MRNCPVIARRVNVMYFANGRLYGERMKQYPYEGLVVTVGTAAIIIPLGMWLNYGAKHWSFLTLAIVCITGLAICLLIGHLVDKRDAVRLKKESQQSPWPVLDLPPSDFQSSSLHETQEQPVKRDA